MRSSLCAILIIASICWHVTMARCAEGDLTVGFRAGLGPDKVHDQMKNLLAQWDS